MKQDILGRIPISYEKGLLSFPERTQVGGAWAVLRLMSTYFPETCLAILFQSIPGWQPQCFSLSTLASGNPFLSLHLFHSPLSKVLGHVSWILWSTRTAALLVSSISLCHPKKLNQGFLQSRLGSDLQRKMENPWRSQVTKYLIESGMVVNKSLNHLPPQVHCMSG